VPPLRDRREDIQPLVEHFLKHFSKEFRKEVRDVSGEAMQKLMAHEWPGNVRELRNVIERAVLLGSGPVISAEDVTPGRTTLVPAEKGKALLSLPQKGLNLEELEKSLVIQALERTGRNQTKAGELLGMTRDQIHYRMEKFGLLKVAEEAK